MSFNISNVEVEVSQFEFQYPLLYSVPQSWAVFPLIIAAEI